MEKQQMPTGEAQNSQKKEWYKSGWGLVIAILLLPYFLLWYMWARTSWSKGVKIAITIIFAFINIVALASDEPAQEKTATSPEKQQVEVAKVEETSSNQEQVAESTPAGLTDEEKTKLKTFYQDLVKYPSKADEAYKDWLASLETTSVPEAYLALNEVENNFYTVWRGFSEMKVPDVNITEEDKKEIKDGLFDLSTAYNTKKNAVKKMQDYLNKNDLEKLSKFKEDMQISDQFVLSGIAKIMGVMTKYEIDIDISDNQ